MVTEDFEKLLSTLPRFAIITSAQTITFSAIIMKEIKLSWAHWDSVPLRVRWGLILLFAFSIIASREPVRGFLRVWILEPVYGSSTHWLTRPRGILSSLRIGGQLRNAAQERAQQEDVELQVLVSLTFMMSKFLLTHNSIAPTTSRNRRGGSAADDRQAAQR